MKKLYSILILIVCIFTLTAFVGCADLSNEIPSQEFTDGLALQNSELVQDSNLRIMSFNALVHIKSWGGEKVKPRAVQAIAMINKYKPDVIGLQEACSDWNKYLNANLSSYKMLHGKRNLVSYNYSPIIYNEDTLELLDDGYMLYSERGNDVCRSVTWGIFKHKIDGKIFAVTNTHFDLIREDYEKWFNIMSVQANELLEIISDIVGERDCVVYSCGDYNSMNVTDEYDGLNGEGESLGKATASEIYYKIAKGEYTGSKTLNEFDICDAKYIDGIERRAGHSDFFNDSDGNIDLSRPKEGNILAPSYDHIFVSNMGDSKVKGYTMLSEEIYKNMSDHFAIYIDVKI